jgi:thiamine-phosphate pyrophosphorylase
MNKIDFNLYLITDRKQLSGRQTLIPAVRNALKGGVKAVQLREKDMDTRDLLKLAYRMRDITEEYKAKLFINDRFDIALAVGADGVHLAQSSMPVGAVRKVVKKNLLIGVSTHSMKEAWDAEKGGADFITMGPVYRTPSKVKYGAPVGLGALGKVCRHMKIPVFALGGIRSSRIKKVRETGAHGVAMISEILRADNIREKTEELINSLNNRGRK